MTFRHLEAFVQVAARASFTRAAEALYVTQPTVSGQIKELEEELGESLFDRLPRAVALTEAGRLLLPLAREVLAARERLGEQAAEYRGLSWGRLTVAVSTIPGECFLPPLLAAFLTAHPGISVSLRVTSSLEVLRQVAAGEAALGVTGERDEAAELSFEPLWSDRVGLYAGAGVVPGPRVALAELGRIPLVHREEGSGTRHAVEAALRAQGFPPAGLRVVLEVGSTAAVKSAVVAGVGAAFLSDVAVAAEVAAGRLRPVAVEGFSPVERRFYAVWDPQRARSPAARAFLDAVRASGRGGAADP